MSRFSRPLLALLCAIVPFFVFLGSTSTTTIKREGVMDTRFNLLGVVLGAVGLWLAFRVLRAPVRDAAAKSVAAIAAVFCLAQLASSFDVIRIDPLDWIAPDRHLPTLQYTGLKDDDRIHLSSYEADTYVWALRNKKSDIKGFAREHAAYAELCHGGRHRIDLARAEAMPDYFSDADIEAIESKANALASTTPTECSARASDRIMGQMADKVNRDMDLTDRLEADYLASLP